MRVSDIMNSEVCIVGGEQSIQEAAKLMADFDIGALPVGDGDRLVGMVTDRDIAIRAVAQGKSPSTPVSGIMSEEVMYCFEDEDVEHVIQNMGDIQVRRLPVMNREKRLVGIVSLGDVATAHSPSSAGLALSGISEPGGLHTQSGGTQH